MTSHAAPSSASRLPPLGLPPLGQIPEPIWIVRPSDPESEKRLLGHGLGILAARVLSSRAPSDPADLNAFLYPSLAATHDPHLLKGVPEAINRIAHAISNDESICIYGDYDVDGVTSTAILKLTFEFLNVDVSTYIPHRLNEGYGLHSDAIRRLADRGTNLIITVDNGISALEEIALANELGVDVVVTDHHQPGSELPPAVAIVNPNQPGCDYPFSDLCGAGVAFKLAHALLKRLAPDPDTSRPFLMSLLDLVALGTVADVVPLVDENRIFVHHGIQGMQVSRRLGIDAMLKKVKGASGSIDADRFSFTIAPRLNAAGRTDRADYLNSQAAL